MPKPKDIPVKASSDKPASSPAPTSLRLQARAVAISIHDATEGKSPQAGAEEAILAARAAKAEAIRARGENPRQRSRIGAARGARGSARALRAGASARPKVRRGESG